MPNARHQREATDIRCALRTNGSSSLKELPPAEQTGYRFGPERSVCQQNSARELHRDQLSRAGGLAAPVSAWFFRGSYAHPFLLLRQGRTPHHRRKLSLPRAKKSLLRRRIASEPRVDRTSRCRISDICTPAPRRTEQCLSSLPCTPTSHHRPELSYGQSRRRS